MRKRLIFSLLIVFLLFTAGFTAVLITTESIVQDLQSVITLHKIEIIRQNFVINVQTVQSNLYATGTPFGKELDTIVENVMALDDSVEGCLGCHHEREMTERLRNVHDIAQQYKEAISHLVTSTANIERIERLKMVAVGIGESLLGQTQEMALIADRSLNVKTDKALHKIQASRTILIVTLLVALAICVIIVVSMTRKITRPVDELVNAARMLGAGDLGYQTVYRDKTEFGEVIDSFNAMSVDLKSAHEKTARYISRLSRLYRITLASSSIAEFERTFDELAGSIAEELGVARCLIILADEQSAVFEACASNAPLTGEEKAACHFSSHRIEELFRQSEGKALVANSAEDAGLFEPLLSGMDVPALAVRLVRQDRTRGVLLVSGRNEPFTEEDVQLLTILANHIVVGLENARLYRDLQNKIRELREAQEQLIQSAKLAAIGELASNVAHEINNPLTSIIGFAEMSLDEDDPEVVRKNIDIIERESLRARDIVRQLLGFARKKPLQLAEVDLNVIVREAIQLVGHQAKKARVVFREEYGHVPLITGDADQLKQVFLNIANNAVAAMPEGGELFVSTSQAGEYNLVVYRDTGTGIPSVVLNRIFEPFFTTKKDKGTGLGLSISYRIIQDHGGRIDVQSTEGKGTEFSVRLPQRSGDRNNP